MSKKTLEVLTVVHIGNYDESGQIIDDSCPCCNWEPPQSKQPEISGTQESSQSDNCDDPEWHLGMIWAPGAERGIGAYFQVLHCQKCGLVYATHVN